MAVTTIERELKFSATQLTAAQLSNTANNPIVRVFCSGQLAFIAFGTIVQCKTGGTGWTTLFSVPEETRPTATQKFALIDDSSMTGGYVSIVEARLSTNGDFQIYSPVTNHNYWGGTLCYIRQ